MHISFDCLATREQPADRARHSGAPRAIIPEQTVDKEPPAVANNLTRDEARDRASLISVESYEISLDLTGGEITFRSETTISFTAALPSAATDTVTGTATDADPDTATATFVDLVAPEVREITLNGTPVSLDAFTGDRIMLTGLQDGGNVLQVVADCAYSRTGEGLHRFTDPADKGVYLYSDLETFDAHRIYPCFDQPDLKARFAFTVTCPDTWVVVSNMAPVTAAAKHGPGTERWVFPPTPPMSTYITAIAAGPYHRVTADHDGIPLGIYCRQSLAQYLDPDEIFEITRQGFDYFHENFGVRYAFGKYDQLFVPEYKAGAMENAGCVTFLEDYIFRSRVTESERETRAETILHEMAHMWFGDLVTMRWWDDLWLNESFATWAGRPRPPAGRTRGPRSPRTGRRGRTGRTSCPPPTRSPPTRRTSRPSRSTSTASPTPRARPCSSSWSPTWAGPTSWPGSVPTSPSTPGATPPWLIFSAR
jgi:aminopeptidase N